MRRKRIFIPCLGLRTYDTVIHVAIDMSLTIVVFLYVENISFDVSYLRFCFSILFSLPFLSIGYLRFHVFLVVFGIAKCHHGQEEDEVEGEER